MIQTEHPSRATLAVRKGNDARRAGIRAGGIRGRLPCFLMVVFLFGMMLAATAEAREDYFTIRNSPGQIKPSPPMAFTVDGDRVAYYSLGRDMDVMPPAKYSGIGKYTAQLTDQYRTKLDQLKRILAGGEIASVPGRNIGSVLAYSFDLNGKRYEGNLQYRYSDPIGGTLSFLYSLAQDLLDRGTSEINLRPAFTAHAASGNLVVEVVFGNDGAQEVVIDGPGKWLPQRVDPKKQYVYIGALNDARVGFDVQLVEKYLSPASRPYASSISVKPGQRVKVEFVVPYDELTFDPGSSAQQIQGGTFLMVGVANVDIQSPAAMKGKAFIRMDEQPAVDLTER